MSDSVCSALNTCCSPLIEGSSSARPATSACCVRNSLRSSRRSSVTRRRWSCRSASALPIFSAAACTTLGCGCLAITSYRPRHMVSKPRSIVSSSPSICKAFCSGSMARLRHPSPATAWFSWRANRSDSLAISTDNFCRSAAMSLRMRARSASSKRIWLRPRSTSACNCLTGSASAASRDRALCRRSSFWRASNSMICDNNSASATWARSSSTFAAARPPVPLVRGAVASWHRPRRAPARPRRP